MKVLFFTNLPSPYRVEFFNELGKQCDLTVLYQTDASKERNAEWKRKYEHYTYKSEFLKTLAKFNDSALCVGISNYFKKNKFDIVVVTGNSTISEMEVIFYLKRKKIPYLFECDGGIPKSGRGPKEWLKKVITSGAKIYFSTGKMSDSYLLMYGAPQSAIRHYPFTSIFEGDILTQVISADKKEALKKTLEISEKKIIVSVGRFSYLNGYGKGYDALLRAAEKLDHNIGIYIIGDEPTEEFINMKQEKGLEHVHFLGFMGKEKLKQYYQAANLFVLMTISDVWGLVVNEAMSNGLPVITTNMCGAAPDLVIPDENGYIVHVGDDVALKDCAEKILSDDCLQKRMSENSLRIVRGFTYEKMVAEHMKVFQEYMSGRIQAEEK